MPEVNKELPEDPGTSETSDEERPKPKKGALRLLLTVLPVLLLPAVAGAYLAYSQYPRLAQAADKIGIEYGATVAAEEEEAIQYGVFTTIGELLINPAGSGGKGFLVVSIGLETKSGAVITEIEEKDIVVRDAILRLLSEHTKEELASIAFRTSLKDEILQELNSVLDRGKIDRLYFTQYLLQ